MIHTGAWTAKAIEELKKIAEMRMAASTEAEKFTRVPRQGEIKLSPDASYVHMCTNNTIEGTQFTEMPQTGAVPLVADMSSDILSRPLDVNRFGLIFAGAQKNLGPSGVTVVIARKDLIERGSDKIAKILQYRTHAKEKSLYNTPPTFAIYVLGLVVDWVAQQGGVSRDRKDQFGESQAALRRDRLYRLLHMPGREGITIEDERGVPRGRRRRGRREEVRERRGSGGADRNQGASVGRRDARFDLQRGASGSRGVSGELYARIRAQKRLTRETRSKEPSRKPDKKKAAAHLAKSFDPEGSARRSSWTLIASFCAAAVSPIAEASSAR